MKSSKGKFNLDSIIRRAVERSGAERLLVAYSGGADSTALLRSLSSGMPGLHIEAVHCNFHLRGEESDGDEAFASALCKELRIQLHIRHFDTRTYCSQKGLSLEMGCRELRYGEFEKIMGVRDLERIVTAHHADDQAETVLLNLMRGGGVKGLRGMEEDTGKILRPLLSVRRRDILAYLESIGQEYRNDSTNSDNRFRRNFLRNKVIPLLEEEWSGAVASICRTASNMAQDEKVLEHCDSSWRKSDSQGGVLSYKALQDCPQPEWLLGRFCREAGLNHAQQTEVAHSFFSGKQQPGKRWSGSKGILVSGKDGFKIHSFPNTITNSYPEGAGIKCECHENSAELLLQIKSSPETILWTPLPPDKIVFRAAERGDRIRPLGMAGSTSVFKIMKEKEGNYGGISERLVAESEGEIIWIEGLRRGKGGLVTSDDREVYKYWREK